jgi:hypothetical protein
MIRLMKIAGASDEKVKPMENDIQLHRKSYDNLLSEKYSFSDLLTFKGSIKELSDQVFDEAKRKVIWDTTHKEALSMH